MAEKWDQYKVEQQTDEWDKYKAGPPREEIPKPSSYWQKIWQNIKDVGQGAGETAENIPGSALKFGESMVTPILHPIQTVKDLTSLVEGGIDELVPGAFPDKRIYADAFAKGIAERYGGWNKVKETMKTDPVGFMADLSTVITGVGGLAKAGVSVTSKAGIVGKLGAVAKAGEKAVEAGRMIEPINVFKQVVKLPMKAIPEAVLTNKAERLYTSALKGMTGQKWPPEKRGAAVKVGLEEKIPVTKGGVVKLNDLIDLANDEFAQKIDALAKTGTKISQKQIVRTFDELEEFYGHYPSYKFKDELATVKDQFLLKYSGGIAADEAQKIKQTIYAIHRKHYGELKGAEIEGNKAIARGIREELIKHYPELDQLGMKEKAMIDLDSALEASIKRLENKDIIGIGGPIYSGAASLATGSRKIGLIAGLAKYAFGNPAVKSKLAIALNQAKQGAKVKISPRATTIRQTLYGTGKVEEMSQPALTQESLEK